MYAVMLTFNVQTQQLYCLYLYKQTRPHIENSKAYLTNACAWDMFRFKLLFFCFDCITGV